MPRQQPALEPVPLLPRHLPEIERIFERLLIRRTLQLRSVHQLHVADRRLRRRLPIRQPNPVLQGLNERFLVGIELVSESTN